MSLKTDKPTRTLLRVLSWNVDMDTEPIVARTLALIRSIRMQAPHVVCLQELTRQTYNIINKALCSPPPPLTAENTDHTEPNNQVDLDANHEPTVSPVAPQPRLQYAMHCSSDWVSNSPYFCAILTRHNLFDEQADLLCNVHMFEHTHMSRGYVQVCGTLPSQHRVSLITTHLESLKTSTAQRKVQLDCLLKLQREMVQQGHVTVLAGDTNLRETEVSARQIQKALPKATPVLSSNPPQTTRKRKRPRVEPKFLDAWVLNGMNPQHKFTWDMSVNDNLDGFTDFKPMSRFDRAFLLSPQTIDLSVPQFDLVGKLRLPCEKFISDHWGLLFTLQCDGIPVPVADLTLSRGAVMTN